MHEIFLGEDPQCLVTQKITYEPSESELMPNYSQEGNEKLITEYTMIRSKLGLTPQERDLGDIDDSAFICHLSSQHKRKM